MPSDFEYFKKLFTIGKQVWVRSSSEMRVEKAGWEVVELVPDESGEFTVIKVRNIQSGEQKRVDGFELKELNRENPNLISASEGTLSDKCINHKNQSEDKRSFEDWRRNKQEALDREVKKVISSLVESGKRISAVGLPESDARSQLQNIAEELKKFSAEMVAPSDDFVSVTDWYSWRVNLKRTLSNIKKVNLPTITFRVERRGRNYFLRPFNENEGDVQNWLRRMGAIFSWE